MMSTILVKNFLTVLMDTAFCTCMCYANFPLEFQVIYYIPVYFLVGSSLSVACMVYIFITKDCIALLLNVLEIKRRHMLVEFLGYKLHGQNSNPTRAIFYSSPQHPDLH
jgi:ABC-type protease/lipase transport system fused ATPase/permease subunit